MEIKLQGSDCVAVIDDEDYPRVQWLEWSLRTDVHRRYVCAHIPGVSSMVLMHRMIYPPPKGMVVDHIDGDGLNNRKSNLRHVTTSQNAFNARLSKRNKTGVKGISKTTIAGKPYWACQVTAHGKTVKTTLKDFDKAVEWVTARRNEMHGEFANFG